MATNQDPHPDASKLQEQLKRTQMAYQMASEMSQFKAGFLARISHELRSPLNSLIGMHQLILSDLCEDPEEEREFVGQAHAAALKLVGLIDNILNVARTEYGSNQLDIQPLQLAQVFNQVYDLTHLQAANRNLRLQIEPPAPDLYVLADLRWLRQVLLNLVDTPLKHMQEGSVCLSVHPESASGYVHIWIEDERPADTLSEPLDLLQSAAENKGQIQQEHELSPGLNLLMSQTILELMNGRLEVLAVPSSKEEKLTRIQCSIPLATSEMRLLD